MTAAYTRVPPIGGGTPREMSQAIAQALRGKINSVGTVTLNQSTTKTTVNNSLVGKTSKVFLMAQTLHAAAAWATTYVDPANYTNGESFDVTHSSSTQSDRTFAYAILGL